MPFKEADEVKKAFDEADKDKTGGLSSDQLKQAFRLLFGDQGTEDQIGYIYDMLAVGGVVTLDKLLDWNDGKIHHKDEWAIVNRIRNSDKDGDGFIDFEEMRRWLMMFKGDDQATEIAEDIMKKMDACNTRKVKPTALIRFMGYEVEDDAPLPVVAVEKKVKGPKEKAKDVFKMYDTNADGRIDKKELAEYLSIFLGEAAAMKDDPMMASMMEMLIAEFDKDADGKLNFEEFCAMVDAIPDLQN